VLDLPRCCCAGQRGSWGGATVGAARWLRLVST
jgi:hypothetical protein